MSLAVAGRGHFSVAAVEERQKVKPSRMPDWRLSASIRLATTSGMVPGLSAAPRRILRSWRAVMGSSSLSLARKALLRSMRSLAPATAAAAFSAPARSPVCSGLTSVTAAQAASEATRETGWSKVLIVSTNSLASRATGVGLRVGRGCDGAGEPRSSASTETVSGRANIPAGRYQPPLTEARRVGALYSRRRAW
jgi:hypothetical protein